MQIYSCSPQRSGHNAILYWLLHQKNVVKQFVRVKQSKLTYGNAKSRDREVTYGITTDVIESNLYLGVTIHSPPIPPAFTKNPIVEELDYDLIIWNLVDNEPESLHERMQAHGQYNPDNKIIIIREFKNWIASLVKHMQSSRTATKKKQQWLWDSKTQQQRSLMHTYLRTYLEHAQYFLSSNEYTTILYDKWFSDEDYRKQIVSELGLEFTDMGRDKVSKHGRGSSFDGLDYNGKALEMNVLERYKTMINDDEYIEYISNNQEALDLSNQIVRSLP